MGSRLLAKLTVAVLTLGGLVFLNKEQTVNLMKVVFADWMDQHAIEYATDEENVYRFAVFQENLAYIQEQNSNQNEYTLGANNFMGLSQEEFRAMYLGYKPQQQVADVELNQVWQDGDVDYRKKGTVTPVKDQGQCASGWAFSATGSMESAFLLFGKVPLPSLSESQLVDCSVDQGNQGCQGGFMDYAFTYAMSTNMTTEADYPYVPKDRACNNSAFAKGTYRLSGFTDVKANDVAGLQAAVTIQPVSVAVEAITWQFYQSGGVFDGQYCTNQLNHGVLAVGFQKISGQLRIHKELVGEIMDTSGQRPEKHAEYLLQPQLLKLLLLYYELFIIFKKLKQINQIIIFKNLNVQYFQEKTLKQLKKRITAKKKKLDKKLLI